MLLIFLWRLIRLASPSQIAKMYSKSWLRVLNFSKTQNRNFRINQECGKTKSGTFQAEFIYIYTHTISDYKPKRAWIIRVEKRGISRSQLQEIRLDKGGQTALSNYTRHTSALIIYFEFFFLRPSSYSSASRDVESRILLPLGVRSTTSMTIQSSPQLRNAGKQTRVIHLFWENSNIHWR